MSETELKVACRDRDRFKARLRGLEADLFLAVNDPKFLFFDDSALTKIRTALYPGLHYEVDGVKYSPKAQEKS